MRNPSRVTPLAVLVLLLALPSLASAQSYNLEVLIFENLNVGSDEQFPENIGRTTSIGGSSFPDAGLRLTQVAQTLRNSANYRVLYHRAWRQPGYSPSRAVPVAVYNDESTEAGTLEGTVTLNRRRFLHLNVDLWFEALDDLTPVRVRQSRRMRSRELHYLDHPKVGVLVIATPS